MKRILLTACVLLISLLAPALPSLGATLEQVKERGILSICANRAALPFSSDDLTQPGFQLEVAQAIAKIIGVGLRVEWISFRREARYVNCDAFPGSVVTEEAEQGPVKLTKPYYSSGYLLLLPRGAEGVKTFADLDGRKIGVEHESWAHYILNTRGLKTAVYADNIEIIEAVEKGEVEAGAVVAAYVGWYLKQHPDSPLKIADGYIPEPDLRWNVAVGLRYADPALKDAVDQALDQLQREGTIQSILAKYGIPYYPPFTPTR
ncbi:MAG: transporter substrate-binding domain-containing protein [candidate division NC10 bacterium]|nr:transporter substrate-binding domain-containing protein [candidate division NC10 bacterium]